MAQDEKMLAVLSQIANWTPDDWEMVFAHRPDLVERFCKAALSAAPAQPAAVEGAEWYWVKGSRPLCGEEVFSRDRAVIGRWEKDGSVEIVPLYTHPSPTPAADVVRSQPDDPTEEMIQAALEVDFDNEDERGSVINLWHVMIAAAPPAADVVRSEPDDPTEEMIQAALEVDFDNEDERGAVINLWHVMKAAAPPAADDALRVAVEALEDAAHEAHGRGYVQGFADAVWDETGDYDEKALTKNLDPEKLRDGWYDDARHTYRDAQTKTLAALKSTAALKAGGVK